LLDVMEVQVASLANSTLRSVFVTGLQDAHAVENQALALIDRQLDRIVRYPEIANRLRSHRVETEVQIRRLDEILSSLNARNSSPKGHGFGLRWQHGRAQPRGCW
jgi:ferritin-like metal-binding protein YciE